MYLTTHNNSFIGTHPMKLRWIQDILPSYDELFQYIASYEIHQSVVMGFNHWWIEKKQIPSYKHHTPFTIHTYTIPYTHIYPLPYTHIFNIYTPFTLHTYTLYHTPFTIHPLPYTLYHTPFTIHPLPYTQTPLPYTHTPLPYTLTSGVA